MAFDVLINSLIVGLLVSFAVCLETDCELFLKEKCLEVQLIIVRFLALLWLLDKRVKLVQDSLSLSDVVQPHVRRRAEVECGLVF